MCRVIFAALALLVSLAHGPVQAEGGQRIALVIGNGDYRSVERLRNSVNDARLIAVTLSELGFALIGGGPRTDLDKSSMLQAIQEFGRAVQGADVALFYYSGHGLQVQGTNWLVPTDANPTRTQDLEFQAVGADLILRQMEGVGTRLNIVILDACRNNPFPVRGLRSMGGGLAEMRAPEGTLISYATQPGAVAHDGVDANSPYTKALAETMKQPGLDVFRTFNQVGLRVKRATGGEQQPWVSSSPIDGDFAFAGLIPPSPALARVSSRPGLQQPIVPRAIIPCRRGAQRGIRPIPRDADTECQPAAASSSTRTRITKPHAPKQATPASTTRPESAPKPACPDIVARVQLGEPLSAADRSALATGCAR